MSGRFGLDTAAFCDKSMTNADKAARGITLALFEKVVMNTPVDTGGLRANWQPTIGFVAGGTIKELDPSGGLTLTKIAAEVAKFGIGKEAYLTNNLPYAYRIEYEGWSHTKAPAGMVRISMAGLPGIKAL